MASIFEMQRGDVASLVMCLARDGYKAVLEDLKRGKFSEAIHAEIKAAMENGGADEQQAFLGAVDVACAKRGLPRTEAGKLDFPFTVVRIPADSSLPFEEISLRGTSFGDQCVEALKPFFAGGEVKNVEHLEKEYGADAVRSKMSGLALTASEGSVEIFSLVRPSSTTLPMAHVGTYLYLDEMGVPKGKALNKRAFALTEQCGLSVESPFYGDVFVGRVRVQPTPMEQVSFGLADLDDGSGWLKCAPDENRAYAAVLAEYEAAKSGKPMAAAVNMAAPSPYEEAPERSRAIEEEEEHTMGWAQNDEELEVFVPVPPGTAKGQLVVEIRPTALFISLRGAGANGANRPLLILKLHAAVQADGSTWTLHTNEEYGLHVNFSLEKQVEAEWPALEAPKK
jgi:hypothetical protein